MLAAVAACRTGQAVVEDRAVVVHPSPEARGAIAQAVVRALSLEGNQVSLDDDALTHDSTLVIGRSQLRVQERLVVGGRDPNDPGEVERFHLVKAGEHCLLVHDRTGRHYELVGTVCAPL